MAASRDESVVSEDMHSRLSSVLGKLASATDEEVGEDAAGVVASVTTNVCRLYRPASRDDFARRLCSFRNAAQWFGKPVAVGPVACARRGWRNVAVDLLECELCGEKLSFPVPPAWNHEEIQQAGAKFEPKLDSAHALKCKWRGTCCPVSVCEFPVQAPEKLVSSFVERCLALGGLPRMPRVATNAALASMPSHIAARAHTLAAWSGLESKVDDEQTLTLRVAALYGWDVQRLPFKAPAAAAAAAAASADRAVCSSDDGDSCLLHCALCGVSTPLWGVAGTAWATPKPPSAAPLTSPSPSPSSRKNTSLSAVTPMRWQSLAGGSVGLNLSIAGGASPLNTPSLAAATNPFLASAFGASPTCTTPAAAASSTMPPPPDREPTGPKRAAGSAQLAPPKRARTGGGSSSEAEASGEEWRAEHWVPPARDDGLVVFNPITHHRPYCTWITTPQGAAQGPGWLRVLDAVLPPSADAPSTSRITSWNGKGNPMRIVYGIFDGEDKQ